MFGEAYPNQVERAGNACNFYQAISDGCSLKWLEKISVSSKFKTVRDAKEKKKYLFRLSPQISSPSITLGHKWHELND